MIKSFFEWLAFICGQARCLLGYHLPGEYCGEIHIADIDRTLHRIEYANKKKCPRCGKVIALDFG